METIILQILGVVIGFGFLIFIHELGHFSMAKFFNVKVLTFAFGFGKELFGFTKGETRYSLRAIPFGGFVAMEGENPDEATGKEREYFSISWWKRILICFFGPFLNYVLAVFIFVAMFNIWGAMDYTNKPVIGEMLENYPAAQAGLIRGDKVNSIDGNKVSVWNDISKNLGDKANKQVVFNITRADENGEVNTFDVTLTPAQNPSTGGGMIGVNPQVLKTKVSFATSVVYAVRAVVNQTVFTLVYLYDKLLTWEKPDIAGPIGVFQVMGKAAANGMEHYLQLLAVISVALGLFNLLPIPMVDGGMIVLFAVEGITRKKVKTKVIQIYNTIGFALIIGIFLFATYNDLLRLGLGKLFK
jgi:regulator of sigma E protease